MTLKFMSENLLLSEIESLNSTFSSGYSTDISDSKGNQSKISTVNDVLLISTIICNNDSHVFIFHSTNKKKISQFTAMTFVPVQDLLLNIIFAFFGIKVNKCCDI